MAESTALATTQPTRLEKSSPFSFAPTNFSEALQFADRLANSELVPKAFQKKPQDILVAMQLGAEVGLAPMQSLKSIGVINGMPSLYGDGFLAVIMGHPQFEWIKEDNLEDIAKNKAATCTIKRRGMEPHTVTFTEEMAKSAGLLGKAGPWTQYKPRQMQMRARGFCGRDTFADALRGIGLYDEIADYDTIDAVPSQPKPQGHIAVPTVNANTTLTEVLLKKDAAPPQQEQQPAETAPEAAAENPDAEPVDPEMVKALEAEAKKWAVDYYHAYQAAGKSPADSKAFLVKQFDVDDSRKVPVAKRDYAMEQAKAGFPVMAVEEKF